MDWQPIETAPKDGRPVWVRGQDWGKFGNARHFGWAFFDGDVWKWADAARGNAVYLTEWMPTS